MIFGTNSDTEYGGKSIILIMNDYGSSGFLVID
jgi:hypothetical protein